LAFNDPEALRIPYQVRTPVPVEVFRLFVDSIEGKMIEDKITPDDIDMLQDLCREFGFRRLMTRLDQISGVRTSLSNVQCSYPDIGERLSGFECQLEEHQRQIRDLTTNLSSL
jgi:hypothetical protein